MDSMDASQSLIKKSFAHVLIGALSMAVVASTGCFRSAHIYTGFSHYAETPYWGRKDLLPSWLPLPANTAVNIGYVLVGLYWIDKIRQIHQTTKSFDANAYMFYAFSWMSVLYGFVQCGRILLQHHVPVLAVLDQWYTLPIFAWIVIWSHQSLFGWNSFWTLFIIVSSISSYGFSLLNRFGFEVALSCHIVAAVYCGIVVYQANRRRETLSAFLKAVLCCAGFVCLKLLDGSLAQSSFFFRYLSGHFWSKIADFLQIHYACQFFCPKLHDA